MTWIFVRRRTVFFGATPGSWARVLRPVREKRLFARVIAFANLHRAFRGASAGKRDRRSVQEFEYHLESRLWEIRRELEEGTYRWGAYRRFVIQDPKRREIRAAPFRDRVVHHAIFDVLDPIFTRGFIADTYACLPGRGTHRAVERFRAFLRARCGAGYVVQCDVESYFASVDHEVLFDLVARRIGDPRLLELVRSLIAHGGEDSGRGMPIGNLTSQLFANLYLDSLDHFVKEELRVRHYVRYMDDFILLLDGRGEARARLAEIESFLSGRLRLRLNPRRIVLAPVSCPRDFLGYVQHPDGRTRVRRRSVRRLWRRLALLDARLERKELAWTSVRASLASWHGLAKHADAFRLSREIFGRRDVRNLGKRLLVRSLGAPSVSVASRWRRLASGSPSPPLPTAL
jgi:retron-type reverse transcriptase